MDKLPIKSAFTDKTNTAVNRGLIKTALERTPHTTSELLSVFIFNAQSDQHDRSLFDTPIPIDTFDQMRLQGLRLVVGTNRFAPAERKVPTDILTDLGLYVVSNTVVINKGEENDSLPEIDTDELLRLVS